MPYITEKEREEYKEPLFILMRRLANKGWKPGHLNYVIYQMVSASFRSKPSYTRGNRVLGVLSAVGHEFYRRLLAPYEDEKIEENGDV